MSVQSALVTVRKELGLPPIDKDLGEIDELTNRFAPRAKVNPRPSRAADGK